jgi:hypothetical protein
MRTLRAHFNGKVLVPEEPVDLPQGRSLRFQVLDEVTPHPTESTATLHEFLQGPSRVTKEDVDALEQSLREGKLPVRYSGPFDADQ